MDDPAAPLTTPESSKVSRRATAKDFGKWKYTPWKGQDMWTHSETKETSFNRDFVRKQRKQ